MKKSKSNQSKKKQLPKLKKYNTGGYSSPQNTPNAMPDYRKFGKGGFWKDAGDIGMNFLRAEADTALTTLGADNVIQDSEYKGKGADQARKAANVVGGIGKVALPMVANMVVPGSGVAISAAQKIGGSLNPEAKIELDANGNPIHNDKSKQFGQMLGQAGGEGLQAAEALGAFAKYGGMFKHGGMKHPHMPNFSSFPPAPSGMYGNQFELGGRFGSVEGYSDPNYKYMGDKYHDVGAEWTSPNGNLNLNVGNTFPTRTISNEKAPVFQPYMGANYNKGNNTYGVQAWPGYAGVRLAHTFANGGEQPNAQLESRDGVGENYMTPGGQFGSVPDNTGTHEQQESQMNPKGNINIPSKTIVLSAKLKPQGSKESYAKLNKKNNTEKQEKIVNNPGETSIAKSTANIIIALKNQMTKKLFNDQEAQKKSRVAQYAAKLGVDINSLLQPSKDNESQEPQGMSEQSEGEMTVAKYGGIHIKPENRGKFTAYKERTGKTTEEALHSPNAHVRQMANFARNAAKWKHEMGGVHDGSKYGLNLSNDDVVKYSEKGYYPADLTQQDIKRIHSLNPNSVPNNQVWHYKNDNGNMMGARIVPGKTLLTNQDATTIRYSQDPSQGSIISPIKSTDSVDYNKENFNGNIKNEIARLNSIHKMGGMQKFYGGGTSGGHSDATGSYDSQGNMIAGPMGEILNDDQYRNAVIYGDAWNSSKPWGTTTQEQTDYMNDVINSYDKNVKNKTAANANVAAQPVVTSATPVSQPSPFDPKKGQWINGKWVLFDVPSTLEHSTPEGTFNAAGEQTSSTYGRPMMQTFDPIQGIQTNPKNPLVVTNLTDKDQAEKDLQNSYKNVPSSIGELKSPKDYSNYADYARQAAIFTGQNLGNIRDFVKTRGGKEFDTEHYGQMTPQMPDYSEALRTAQIEANATRKSLKDMTGGNVASYLSNLGSTQTQNALTQAKIREAEQQARTGVYNQFLPLNKQLQMQERADTQANKARSEDIARMAVKGLSENIGGAGSDYGMSKRDQDTLAIISSAYPDYAYDTKKKGWYHRTTKEKLDPNKVKPIVA